MKSLTQRRWCARATVWLVGVYAVSAQSATIFVDSSASGSVHDGSSWCRGFVNLQDALSMASFGDDVQVANGAYKPDLGEMVGLGDRLASFGLASGVAVRGGYAGCGAVDPNARNVALYVSTLSGDLAGNDAPQFLNRSDNSYHVVTYSDPDAVGSVLEGFTVRGGHADGTGPPGSASNQGSGIHIRLNSQMCIPGGPTIRNCIIEDNWSLNHGAINIHADRAIIDGCTIRNNHSEFRGGGLLIQSGNATVRNCLITDNYAKDEGGGVWTGHSADPTCAATSGAFFENCAINSNTTDLNGGGFFAGAFASSVISDCVVDNNHAKFQGGGLHSEEGSITITSSTFSNNVQVCDEPFCGGGGVWLDTGLATLNGVRVDEAVFTDCTFRGNTAGRNGGGVQAASTALFASPVGCSRTTWQD